MSQPAPSYPQPVAPQADPGRTLGIVGLVLAFLLPLIGLILSIVARVQSSRAGYKNGLALAGIIVSIVIMVAVGATIGFSVAKVAGKCAELGPGVHQEGGVTYTCG